MSDGDDRSTIENRDIAFKPAESGWGSGTKYASNYDNIAQIMLYESFVNLRYYIRST